MLKLLFLVGLGLAVAGSVAALVGGFSLPIPSVLLGVGVLAMAIAVFQSSGGKKGFWGKRSIEAGTNATVATLSMLTILAAVNFLAFRHGFRLDLTENQLYTLAPETQQVVESLERPLGVWVFTPTPNPADEALLENYRDLNSAFDYEFVDPTVEVGLVERFGVGSIGEVYLEYQDKQRLVGRLDAGNSLSEAQLTNAIQGVRRSHPGAAIYFLQGHGEPPLDAVEGGFSQAAASLEQEGYQVAPLNLPRRDSIPDNTGTIIVASPQQPLLEGEIERLQKHMAAGGTMLLLVDPDLESNLGTLLEPWGIELDNRVAIDASGRGYFGPVTPLVTRYGEHPITNAFGQGISFYPLARPVLWEETERVESTPLLFTDEQSWAESNLAAEQLSFDPESDRRGPLILGYALQGQPSFSLQEDLPGEPAGDRSSEALEDPEQEATEEESGASQAIESTAPTASETPDPEELQLEPSQSETGDREAQLEATESDSQDNGEEGTRAKLVVIGNSTFATNGWFSQQLNGDLFLNSVEWLASSEQEPTLSIRPRQQTDRRINLSPQQGGLLGWLALAIVPGVALLAAIVTWWRRR